MVCALNHASLKPALIPPAKGYRPGCAVIDGLNVIRAKGKEFPRLAILIDSAMRLLAEGYDVLCISDANTSYELAEREGNRIAELYRQLLADYPTYFVECPGRMQADPIILAEANSRGAVVVSNDQFRQPHYARRFNWISDQTRFLRVATVRDHYYLGECQFDIPTSIELAVVDLRCILHRILIGA